MSKGLNSHLKTAVKSSTLILVAAAASQFLWFCIKILIIRNTTKVEFGIYSLMLTIFGILAAVVPLGVPTGVLRFVSINQGADKKAEADEISKAGTQLTLGLGLAAFVLIYLFSGQIARNVFYTPELAGPLKMISILLPFSIYSALVLNVLLGNGFIRQKIFNDILMPVFYVLLVFLALRLHARFQGILFAYVLSSLSVFLFIIAFGFTKLGSASLMPFAMHSPMAGTTRNRRHWELLKFSIPLQVDIATYMVISWTDTLMVGRYVNAQAVGTYNVSVTLSNLLVFPINALFFVFLPIAGELYANGGGELKRAYQVLTKWIFAITLPLFFVLFFFPEMCITTLFGTRFLAAAMPLRFLAIGLLVNVFCGLNAPLVMVMGLSRDIMKISTIGAVFNIALNYVLVKRIGLGLAGAAVSTMSSNILLNLLYSLKLYRHSRIHPFSSAYLKPISGAAISGLLIYAAAKSLPLPYWLLPVYFLLFIIGYGASLLFTKSIEEEDIFIFERVLNRLGANPKYAAALLGRFAPKIAKPRADM
ncbi:MAG: oligosaccharide flippase family protein [Actinomycetota bacterium]|nr:oligosaccharide flippase family protein [Actinomycetota bacterium]